jgi:hypothetical protein
MFAGAYFFTKHVAESLYASEINGAFSLCNPQKKQTQDSACLMLILIYSLVLISSGGARLSSEKGRIHD